MATSRSMTELARRFAIIANIVKANSLQTIQKAAIAADQTLVFTTPVDTGRARANWLVSVAVPKTGVLPEPDSPGSGANKALEEGRGIIAGYKLGAGGIFITNNLPYIALLDRGSSVQAPRGMTEAALEAARKRFGEAKILKGV